jgi:hypothetical protein
MPDPVQRLAAKLERQGHEPAVAAAMAKAAARKLGREHEGWARADEPRTLEEALDHLAAVQTWVNEQVHGFGGRRRRRPSERLLELASERLREAGEHVSRLLAEQRA